MIVEDPLTTYFCLSSVVECVAYRESISMSHLLISGQFNHG